MMMTIFVAPLLLTNHHSASIRSWDSGSEHPTSSITFGHVTAGSGSAFNPLISFIAAFAGGAVKPSRSHSFDRSWTVVWYVLDGSCNVIKKRPACDFVPTPWHYP